MGEGHDANSAGRASERVTIAEAATLLRVHPNTVRNRVRAGVYRAEKVITERGPTWRIDRDSLTTNALSSDPQQLVSRVPQEALTALAREIVREARTSEDAEHDRVLSAIHDYWKIQYDFAKQLSVASGVLLLGLIALLGVFYPYAKAYPAIAYVAAVLLAVGAVGALVGMRLAIGVIGTLIEEEEDAVMAEPRDGGKYPLVGDSVARANTRFKRWMLVPLVGLSLGALCFLCFAALNLVPLGG